METTFSQLLLQHVDQGAPSPALCAKEYGIWQTPPGQTWPSWWKKVAAGLHRAGLLAPRTHGGDRRQPPRLYATMLAAQSLGAIPVPLYQDAVAARCIFR